ncbi:hypothetical protein [Pseudoxanthomonas sp. JBR18]|uniref:hypothetical protein n=1 Tax=Pseudoxanthomonas sp. JBR18 TaxID=2969308 RepID=UPI0023063EA9|nr:hypothetical protein [Pseudoxanthomonas sp. JBR18]WCE04425.1 hypothetical protein PJ250_20565 [Pseudoxanthomonas sp. JBR18]
MAQGWTINATADTITFYEPPANGAAISVKEFGAGGSGGTYIWAVGAWSERFGYPGEAEFFNDRLWFAGSVADPQTVWASNIGDYNNFGRSSPIIDSDAVSFTINARQVNAIRDLVPLDSLLIMTTGGEYKVTGGQDDVVTPSTIGVKPQSNHGSGSTQARVTGDTALFIKEQGQHVRDLGYQFEKDGFRGVDLSIWADHLVEGYSFKQLEFAPAPWSVVWIVRNDGVMIGCTYLPEQEVTGWHPHDTQGQILDVCCLPRQDETQTYVLVQRQINGQSVQYIEQMAPTRYEDPADYKYSDSLLTYDGRNTDTTTVKLDSPGGGWTENDALTLTASAAKFVGASDVGDGFVITSGESRVRVRIIGYTSSTVVTVNSIGTVPEALRGVATTGWTFQRDSISGLGHLEGREVVVLVDGSVHPKRTVTGGAISLDSPAGVVQVGLGYRGHIETLEVNASGGEPMRPMKKLTFQMALQVRHTVGVYFGTSLDLLDPVPQREFENYDEPTSPSDGVLQLPLSAQWGQDTGHVHIVSDDPLPMEVLSILPKIAASET